MPNTQHSVTSKIEVTWGIDISGKQKRRSHKENSEEQSFKIGALGHTPSGGTITQPFPDEGEGGGD